MSEKSIERNEPIVFHYSATVTVDATCKETGKVFTTTFGTEYHSGKEEPDKTLINKKVLKQVIAEYHEVKP